MSRAQSGGDTGPGLSALAQRLLQSVLPGLYTSLWRLGLGPAWAWWAWRTRRDGDAAERGRWRERLAWAPVPQAGQDGLLMHAASIGEGVAAIALLRALRAQRPDLPVLVTCTSFTGAQRLRRELGDSLPQAYLPFDTPGAMARLLDQARPRAIVLMETELWPNLLAQARARAIPVVLANARLSPQSARGYARAAALARPMLQGLALVQAQSRAIARRFAALGVPAGRLVVNGNLKYGITVPEAARQQAARWRQALGPRPVLVAASTHPGEDEALLAAWPLVRVAVPDALLVLVPRHPQRFDTVARLIQTHGLPLQRRSLDQQPGLADAVWLGDTLGEMLAWMALADAAFIGGSLVPHGGHSPLEAMALGCPLLSGRHVHNFAEAYQALQRAGGVQWLDDSAPAPLAAELTRLLSDPAARQALGAAGQQVFAASAGAAERSAEQIAAMLDQPPGSLSRQDDGHEALWHDTAYQPPLPEAPFEPATWQARGAWRATAGGRGSAGFVDHGPHGLVLRHYRRGGLVARLLHDTYQGRRPEASRAMREMALLLQLRAAGLPVPRPVAARMQRTRPPSAWAPWTWRYRADLLIERLPGTRSLAERLIAGERPPPAAWQALGQAIGRLHAHGLDHVDLNAHNLLLDEAGRAWVIDFDRCRLRPMPPARPGLPGPPASVEPTAWQAANLARLLRSLHKLLRQHPGFAYYDADWPLLTAAHGEALQAPHGPLRQPAP